MCPKRGTYAVKHISRNYLLLFSLGMNMCFAQCHSDTGSKTLLVTDSYCAMLVNTA